MHYFFASRVSSLLLRLYRVASRTSCIAFSLEKTLTVSTHKYAADLRTRFLSGASHWVQQERPDEVNELIQEFVTETELTARID